MQYGKWLLVGFLVVWSAPLLAEEQPKPVKKPAPLSAIDRAAIKVFKEADDNYDAALDKDEFAQAKTLCHESIKKLTADRVIGGVKALKEVETPNLDEQEAVSQTEFVDYFRSLASSEDQAVRQARLDRAKGRHRQAAPQFAGPVERRRRDWINDDDADWQRRNRWRSFDPNPWSSNPWWNGGVSGGGVAGGVVGVERGPANVPIGNNPNPIGPANSAGAAGVPGGPHVPLGNNPKPVGGPLGLQGPGGNQFGAEPGIGSRPGPGGASPHMDQPRSEPARPGPARNEPASNPKSEKDSKPDTRATGSPRK